MLVCETPTNANAASAFVDSRIMMPCRLAMGRSANFTREWKSREFETDRCRKKKVSARPSIFRPDRWTTKSPLSEDAQVSAGIFPIRLAAHGAGNGAIVSEKA